MAMFVHGVMDGLGQRCSSISPDSKSVKFRKNETKWQEKCLQIAAPCAPADPRSARICQLSEALRYLNENQYSPCHALTTEPAAGGPS